MARTPKQDVDIFFPVPKVINSYDGDEIEIPKVAWGKEKQIARLMGGLLRRLPVQDFFDEESNTVNTEALIAAVLEALPTLLEDALDVTTKVVAMILGKDPEWIDENLEMEGVFGIALPFSWNCVLKTKNVVKIVLPPDFKLPIGRPATETATS